MCWFLNDERMEWKTCYAYLCRAQHLRNEEKLIYCIWQVLLHQGIYCVQWRGIWMHKLCYFKTGDIISIYSFLYCVWEQNTFLLYVAVRKSVLSVWILGFRHGRNVSAETWNVWNFESISCIRQGSVYLEKCRSTFKIPLLKYHGKFVEFPLVAWIIIIWRDLS